MARPAQARRHRSDTASLVWTVAIAFVIIVLVVTTLALSWSPQATDFDPS